MKKVFAILVLTIAAFSMFDVTAIVAASDVPSFWEVNDGNLRYIGNSKKQGAVVYSYECYADQYNDYFDRYIRKLNEYPFQQISRSAIDERFSSGLAIEERAYWYYGSKTVYSYPSGHITGEVYDAHLEISCFFDGYSNIMTFYISVANNLTYEPRGVGRERNSFSNQKRSIRPDISPRPHIVCLICKGKGTRTCSTCNGTGKTYEYKSIVTFGIPRPGESDMIKIPQTCRLCRGTGQTMCLYCGGTGYR